MTRALALAALMFVTGPALSEHRPAALLDQTFGEIASLKADINQIPQRHIRHNLDRRIERVEGLLVRLEATGALTQPDRRHVRPERPAPPPPPPALSFDEALHMVRAEAFDRTRLEAVHRAARVGAFTTHEARALAGELTFDSGKADALIALYPAVVDQHRFAMALDVLTFTSSKRRVADALGL